MLGRRLSNRLQKRGPHRRMRRDRGQRRDRVQRRDRGQGRHRSRRHFRLSNQHCRMQTHAQREDASHSVHRSISPHSLHLSLNFSLSPSHSLSGVALSLSLSLSVSMPPFLLLSRLLTPPCSFPHISFLPLLLSLSLICHSCSSLSTFPSIFPNPP